MDTGSPSSEEAEPLRKDTSMDWLFDTSPSPVAQVGVHLSQRYVLLRQLCSIRSGFRWA